MVESFPYEPVPQLKTRKLARDNRLEKNNFEKRKFLKLKALSGKFASKVRFTMKQSSEKMRLRREKAIQAGAAELAHALEQNLVLLRYHGKCKCGLMLTDRDQIPKKKTYSCPHCGRSGALAAISV